MFSQVPKHFPVLKFFFKPVTGGGQTAAGQAGRNFLWGIKNIMKWASFFFFLNLF